MQRIEANEVGLDTLGHLDLYSGWRSDVFFHEVHHEVPTDVLYVEPRRVLFWDAEPDRLNSLKRFAHMLRWRGVAPLSETEAYDLSLRRALVGEVELPSMRRLRSLHAQAATYHREAAAGERVTRLGTSTARILFQYEPPTSKDLKSLHEYLLETR